MHFYNQDWVVTYRQKQFSGLSLYSYLVDWTIYIIILIVFIVYGTDVSPRYHEFSLNDISLMYSYKKEEHTAIPLYLLIIISVILPILQFFGCSIFCNITLSASRRFWDIFVGLMAFCGSMATQLMITCILKNICGLPRPDMLARCQPTIPEVVSGLSTVKVCTNRNSTILQEGFRSFPSGHSSTVFCGMVISSLNIAGKLQVFDKRGISFKVLFAILPIMIACFVSATRISDNKHFIKDVIAGAIIGATISIWFYLQYFPSIFNLENSGRAYPPRRIGIAKFFNNVGGFWKIKDNRPGSFNERYLNSSEILPLVSEIADEENNSDLQHIGDLASNISLFNKLSKNMGNGYVNFNRGGQNSLLPTYNDQVDPINSSGSAQICC